MADRAGAVYVDIFPKSTQFKKRLQAQLKAATAGVKVEIPVELDKKFTSQLKSLQKDVSKAGTKVLAFAGGVGALATSAAAAGPAVAAVSAATASLVGAVASATPAIAALGGSLGALGQGALVGKIAFTGFADAVFGSEKKAKKAMEEMSPAAEAVAQTLRDSFGNLSDTIQETVFRGMVPAFKEVAETAFPVVQTAAEKTGETIRGLLLDFLELASAPFFQADFATITERNTFVLGDFGHAALNLVDALRHILVAAGPVTQRFSSWVQTLSDSALASIAAARESGRLESVFNRGGDAAAQWGAVIRDTTVALFNIFRIGAQEGAGLLTVLENGAARFREWTESARGIAAITDHFRTGQETLASFMRLVSALGRELRENLSGFDLAGVLEHVIVVLVPAIGNLAAAFGTGEANARTLIDTLASLINVFAVKGPGALNAFLGTINLIAGGIEAVVTTVPGATTVLGTLFAVTAVHKAAGLFGIPKALGLIATGMQILATTTVAQAIGAQIAAQFTTIGAAAGAAALRVTISVSAIIGGLALMAAQAVATAARWVASWVLMATQALIQAGRMAVAWLIALGPIGLIIAGVAALVAAVVFAWKNFETFRNIVLAVWQGIQIAAKFAWENILRPIFDALKFYVTGILIPAFLLWWNSIKFGFENVIVPVFRWAWNTIIKPIFDGLKIVIGVVVEAFSLLWKHIKFAWENIIVPVFRWAWETIIKPVFNQIRTVIDVTVVVFGLLWRGIQVAWDFVTSKISSGWNSTIRPTFDALKSALGTVRDTFGGVVDAIGRIWGRLSDIAKAPVRFVIQTVYNDGIRRVANTVARIVGSREFPAVPLPPGLASGGMIPTWMGGGPRADDVLVRASGGEMIVNARSTAKHYPLLEAINADRFADGGIIGDLISRGARGVADKLLGPVRGLLGRVPGAGTEWGALIAAVPRHLISAVLDLFGRQDQAIASGALPPGVTPGGWARPAAGTTTATWMSYPGHTGHDIAGPVGTPIGAAASGVVSAVRTLAGSYGKHMILTHAGGIQTLYAHLSGFNAAAGQVVRAGQLIGRMGSTGNSTGPHLHFETRVGGRPVNPRPFMAARGAGIGGAGGAFAALGGLGDGLPDKVRWGDVSEAIWDQLMAAGWWGDPGDREEAIYRPGTNRNVVSFATGVRRDFNDLMRSLMPAAPPAAPARANVAQLNALTTSSGSRSRPRTSTASGGTGGGAITVIVENNGVLGSRQEVEDWLTKAVDRLRRQGRI